MDTYGNIYIYIYGTCVEMYGTYIMEAYTHVHTDTHALTYACAYT